MFEFYKVGYIMESEFTLRKDKSNLILECCLGFRAKSDPFLITKNDKNYWYYFICMCEQNTRCTNLRLDGC